MPSWDRSSITQADWAVAVASSMASAVTFKSKETEAFTFLECSSKAALFSEVPSGFSTP